MRRLRSVVGFSMGAQQAFQWAVSYPDQVESIVPVCGTAKTCHHGVVRLESAISCLQADVNWNNGDLLGPLENGAEARARHWAAWVYSQEWWRKELFRDNGDASPQDMIKFFVSRFDSSKANDVVLQARTWLRHDVGGSPGFDGDVEAALRFIPARVLYMPDGTDLYFPLTAARYEKQHLKHTCLETDTLIMGPRGRRGMGWQGAAVCSQIGKEVLGAVTPGSAPREPVRDGGWVRAGCNSIWWERDCFLTRGCGRSDSWSWCAPVSSSGRHGRCRRLVCGPVRSTRSSPGS